MVAAESVPAGDVEFDVAVIGGGPVGMAAAIGARLRGFEVVVLEQRGAPVDKACGEGLMPGAVAELEKLGVRPHGHPLAGITYKSAAHPTWRPATHDFRAGPGVGMRRTELQAMLLERALACGVQFRLARLETLTQDARGVTLSFAPGHGEPSSTLRSRWVLGCDGLHSTVRSLLAPAPAHQPEPARLLTRQLARLSTGQLTLPPGRPRRRFGLRQHFAVAPWSNHVEVYWAPRFELYVTPVGERMIGVALLGERGLDLAAAVAATPELAARLDGAEALSPLRGAGPLRQRVTRHVRGRVLLVGDASGYVDALTGEGLRLGFAQAAAAVAALATPQTADVAARYERGWLAASRGPNSFTAVLLGLSRTPLRAAFVPVGAHLPAVFSAAVERLAE